MNFLKLNVSKKTVLVNMDNATEIHSRSNGETSIYFNTMVTGDDQAYVNVDESIETIQKMLAI